MRCQYLNITQTHSLMHKSFILTILAANTLLSSFAQTAGKASIQKTGDWIGSVEGLPLYFRITGDEGSGYKADWNSPAQKTLGRRCKSVVITGDSLIIQAGGINASFRGRYLPGLDSITGTWQQNARSLHMDLRRMKRPQTPHPPLSLPVRFRRI